MKRILIVEDDRAIAELERDYLEANDYEVEICEDGESGLKRALQEDFALILLDVMLPKEDGFQVCREIRQTSSVPIIMVTARGEDFERIMGLDIGADDYIVKPFSGGEVMARVRAVLRRIGPAERLSERKILTYDNLSVCLDDGCVTVGEREISLTKKELEILWTLLENKGKIFSRDHLLDSLWGYDYVGDNRTVDSHMKRLRSKLDVQPHPAWQIKTVWGMGYKFEENHG